MSGNRGPVRNIPASVPSSVMSELSQVRGGEALTRETLTDARAALSKAKEILRTQSYSPIDSDGNPIDPDVARAHAEGIVEQRQLDLETARKDHEEAEQALADLE